MDKADQPPVGGIVTGSGKSRRSLILRIAVLLLIVLAVVGTVGGFAYYRLKLLPDSNHKPATATATTKGMTPAQAVQAAQSELHSADTPAAKAVAYSHLGDAYRSDGQLSQSTTAYQQGLTYSPDDIQLLERLSGQYEDAGDKANAVSTLQKLIVALKASNISEKDFLLSRYQAELQYVQGGN